MEREPNDQRWMAEAIAVATEGLLIGELPIGAVVVADDEIVGRAHTEEHRQGRLLVHAELLALEQADRAVHWDRGSATLYTTLEPCLMCLGATATAMVGRLVFALPSESDGAARLAESWSRNRSGDLPHVQLPSVKSGTGRAESEALMAQFVARRREQDPMAQWAKTLLPRHSHCDGSPRTA